MKATLGLLNRRTSCAVAPGLCRQSSRVWGQPQTHSRRPYTYFTLFGFDEPRSASHCRLVFKPMGTLRPRGLQKKKFAPDVVKLG
ncbi:hypothetical protein BD410DRAFT_388834 [Rickenella mellea]|uniref:Uncharacterized protein n=1 Tax=Rickenella mellea TaxID=50990 RepID=A0A4Y7PZG5_9AGAM|nr:hypothetical protein BD410DRAFT_388834 [Rickenella mellea]